VELATRIDNYVDAILHEHPSLRVSRSAAARALIEEALAARGL
jgi:hypothetical protein